VAIPRKLSSMQNLPGVVTFSDKKVLLKYLSLDWYTTPARLAPLLRREEGMGGKEKGEGEKTKKVGEERGSGGKGRRREGRDGMREGGKRKRGRRKEEGSDVLLDLDTKRTTSTTSTTAELE